MQCLGNGHFVFGDIDAGLYQLQFVCPKIDARGVKILKPRMPCFLSHIEEKPPYAVVLSRLEERLNHRRTQGGELLHYIEPFERWQKQLLDSLARMEGKLDRLLVLREQTVDTTVRPPLKAEYLDIIDVSKLLKVEQKTIYNWVSAGGD